MFRIQARNGASERVFAKACLIRAPLRQAIQLEQHKPVVVAAIAVVFVINNYLHAGSVYNGLRAVKNGL